MNRRNLSFEALNMIAERFKVLSEPIRLQILVNLEAGGMSVNDLAEAVGSSQPNVSKHLKILKSAGILVRTQQGNTVCYSIADDSIFDLCETVCGAIEERLETDARIFRAA